MERLAGKPGIANSVRLPVWRTGAQVFVASSNDDGVALMTTSGTMGEARRVLVQAIHFDITNPSLPSAGTNAEELAHLWAELLIEESRGSALLLRAVGEYLRGLVAEGDGHGTAMLAALEGRP